MTTPRRVAIPMLPKVKAKLECMERLGVVSRVKGPTDWCTGMVVVPKAGGGVRICVDLTRLNEKRVPPTPSSRADTSTASRGPSFHET